MRVRDERTELLVAPRDTPWGFAVELRRLVAHAAATGTVEIEKGAGRLGPYHIERETGRGSMGIVYRARRGGSGPPVAVKLLNPSIAFDPEMSSRFVREARAASRARHPGIVDVVDFGALPDGRAYLVMELVEGKTLEQLLSRGALDPLRAVLIAKQIASALEAAHRQGVVHRDLKPSNVFLAGAALKIADFGAAQVEPRGATAAVDQGNLGTPGYMSPEQASGRPTDKRTDLYSLGCILFRVLTGAPPFRGAALLEVLRKQIEDEAPLVTSPHGPLPDVLVGGVAKALAKRPDDRFRNAAEMRGGAGARPAPARRDGGAVSGRLGVVLLVDAHPETARAALGALPPDEYRVLVVADARQALAVLGGERVDVLVSELALPGDSGLHLLVEARRLHPAVVRVVLTAVAEFAAAVAAINEAEVFRFLGKPVDAAALRGAVDEALGRAEAVREVRGAKAAAERRRVALVDLESDHAWHLARAAEPGRLFHAAAAAGGPHPAPRGARQSERRSPTRSRPIATGSKGRGIRLSTGLSGPGYGLRAFERGFRDPSRATRQGALGGYGSTTTFSPSRRAAVSNAGRVREREAVGHHRAQVHPAGHRERDRARVDVLHAPGEHERQALAARGRGQEGRALLGRDSGEDDAPPGTHRLDRRVDRRVLARGLDRHVEAEAPRAPGSIAPRVRRRRRERPAPRRRAASSRWGRAARSVATSRAAPPPRDLQAEEADRPAAEDADARRPGGRGRGRRRGCATPSGSSIAPSASVKASGSGKSARSGHAIHSRRAPSSAPCPAKRTAAQRLGWPSRQRSQGRTGRPGRPRPAARPR